MVDPSERRRRLLAQIIEAGEKEAEDRMDEDAATAYPAENVLAFMQHFEGQRPTGWAECRTCDQRTDTISLMEHDPTGVGRVFMEEHAPHDLWIMVEEPPPRTCPIQQANGMGRSWVCVLPPEHDGEHRWSGPL